ncbi:IclR family transcriptional regulator [Halorarum salinum]|uniref:IclR family transcriptional regulator n=1 Tax=Halorarum salinum TaxID=2743089 RepID=A0A7D5LD60_9EURY|nr:IclR family transcriptional regulator [Halobaculum salinum]QLG63912.1 IclR family transcriptional regulator [Halobaculum salinum]
MTGKTRPLKTVLRAFEIVDVLEREREAGPSEIAERLGVTRATAHDYLTTLERTGYVMNRGGKYRIGYRFLGVGSRVKYRSSLFNAARAPLRKLSSELDELSHIGIEEGGEWVLLHHEGDVSTVDMGTYPGLRFPIHAHAAGKVILAHLPDDRVGEIIETRGLERVTEHTITDGGELRAELSRIVEEGYAVDSDQVVVGVSLVAAPILVEGELVGSTSIACPTGRLQDDEYREGLIRGVLEAADEISINYRYAM